MEPKLTNEQQITPILHTRHLRGGWGWAWSTQRRGESWSTWRSPAAASCGRSGHLSGASTKGSKTSASARAKNPDGVTNEVTRFCTHVKCKALTSRKKYSVGVIIMKFMYFNFVWLCDRELSHRECELRLQLKWGLLTQHICNSQILFLRNWTLMTK